MRRCGILVLALLSAIAGLVIVKRSPAEPSYEGRRLSAWMDGGSEPAALALHGLGTQAIPFLFSKLRSEHPRWGYRRKYSSFCQNLPVGLRLFLPRPKAAAFDEERACAAFLEIGPSAIPALVAALKDPHPAIRAASAFTLSVLQRNGGSGQLICPRASEHRE